MISGPEGSSLECTLASHREPDSRSRKPRSRAGRVVCKNGAAGKIARIVAMRGGGASRGFYLGFRDIIGAYSVPNRSEEAFFFLRRGAAT